MITASAFDNPRALSARVALVLGGERVAGEGVESFASSRFDPFLNQVFVGAGGRAEAVAPRLDGRPAFVWMATEPAPATRRALGADGFTPAAFTAMEASDDPGPPAACDPEPVRSPDDVAAWHAVYCEVLGPDQRSIEDWRRLHAALGPGGDGSFLLWLARDGDAPAAAGALFLDAATAGLYCFATREPFRRRGLAGDLTGVCRRHARARGAARCVLQASAAGRPVYARAGFADVGPVAIFVRR